MSVTAATVAPMRALSLTYRVVLTQLVTRGRVVPGVGKAAPGHGLLVDGQPAGPGPVQPPVEQLRLDAGRDRGRGPGDEVARHEEGLGLGEIRRCSGLRGLHADLVGGQHVREGDDDPVTGDAEPDICSVTRTSRAIVLGPAEAMGHLELVVSAASLVTKWVPWS